MLRAALALVALLALASTAAAQVPGAGAADARILIEVQDPGAALVPARPYALTVTLHYQYGNGGSVGPGQQPCADLVVDNPPPWAIVNFTMPRVCFPIDNTHAVGGTTVDNTTILEINITGPAAALEPYDLSISARAPAIGALKEATGNQTRTIMPAFVGKLGVQAPRESVVRGGGADPVRVLVTNQGNSPIEVTFRNATAPQGVRVVVPERFTLGLGESREVEVRLQAPWTSAVKGPVTLDAVSGHPSRPDLAGDQVKVKFDVAGKAAVPALDALAFVGVLACLALARRRL